MTESFNLKRALMGQAMCTREGKAVRILATNRPESNKHIIVQDEREFKYAVWPNGRCVHGRDNPRDVLLIEGAFIDADPWDGIRPETAKVVILSWECPVCHAGLRADQIKCDHK